VLIGAVWPSPPALATLVAASALAVAVNVTGDPVAPDTAARAVCVPETDPSVQLLLATPLASVVAEAGVMTPFAAVVDQLTVTFDAGWPP
jgi:hypothetical protein